MIHGNGGDDPYLYGNSGADTIYGDFGNDSIDSGPGSDVLLSGGRNHDEIRGGSGNDILQGNRGSDKLDGDSGDDTLRGGNGVDYLYGDVGDKDKCYGGSHDDFEVLVDDEFSCEFVASIETAIDVQNAVIETSVSPATTDPEINDLGGNHLVCVNPLVSQRDEILVHFPGTFGTPAGNEQFLRTVADQGMKAIGLQYVNDGTINGICSNYGEGDADCQENLRLERIYGIDTSPIENQNVSPANSLVNRLVKLLEYLDAQQPAVGWGGYLDGDQPQWERIVVSGHSQGSGMAALIARDQAVVWVLIFAGPFDFNPDVYTTAGWITDPKATPISKHFGFRHVDDQPFLLTQIWSDMGLPGPAVIVDDSDPPFDHGHFLETDIVAPGNEHGSVIDNANASIFRDVWKYLCCSQP